jgi:hypothetical protein
VGPLLFSDEGGVKLMTFDSNHGLGVVFIPFLEALPYMRDDVATALSRDDLSNEFTWVMALSPSVDAEAKY